MNYAKVLRKARCAVLHPHFHSWDILGNRCPICDLRTVYLCDDPTERWIRRCIWCRSTPKYRAIWMAAAAAVGGRLEKALGEGAAIYELSTTSPIFRALRGRSGYQASAYLPDKPFGAELDQGVWNQDLQKLSFESGAFDLVISSETMEHVRRPWEAFREVWRVLRNGGVYVFTIPYRADPRRPPKLPQ